MKTRKIDMRPSTMHGPHDSNQAALQAGIGAASDEMLVTAIAVYEGLKNDPAASSRGQVRQIGNGRYYYRYVSTFRRADPNPSGGVRMGAYPNFALRQLHELESARAEAADDRTDDELVRYANHMEARDLNQVHKNDFDKIIRARKRDLPAPFANPLYSSRALVAENPGDPVLVMAAATAKDMSYGKRIPMRLVGVEVQGMTITHESMANADVE